MIKNHKAFNEHPSAGFDGIFDWDWITEEIKKVSPSSKITPTDIDCVVERNGHYLIIETKNPGIIIPRGQEILLNNLIHAKDFTVIRLWGKAETEEFNKVFGKVGGNWGQKINLYGLEVARMSICEWFRWANKAK